MQTLGLVETDDEAIITKVEETRDDDYSKIIEDKKEWKQSDCDYTNKKGKLEILAILAHELGHWAHNDSAKSIVSSIVQIFLILFAFSYALNNSVILSSFGFDETSPFVSLWLFLMLVEPPLELLAAKDVYMVRCAEFAADKYSVELGYGLALKDALISIHIKNSANLNPDPLFSALKYSHPPLLERNAAIDKEIRKIVGDTAGEDAEIAYKKHFEGDLKRRHG